MTKWSRAYGGDVVAADHFFGRTWQRLERREGAREWIVAVTADHGEEFREHGRIGHGTDLWREQVRIPLVLRFPERIPAGKLLRERTSLLDIQPTVLDLLSLPTDAEQEGRTLLPELALAFGEADGPDPPEAPPHYLHLIRQKTRLDEAALADTTMIGEVALVDGGLVDGGWKVIVEDYGAGGEREVHLYDLEEDPGERNDLAATYPELTREMVGRALGWWGTERRGSAGTGPAAVMDAETEEALRALGYLQ
jgi:arylsulfatase A-like enzyme